MKTEYSFNPALTFIKENKKGNLVLDGRYVNGEKPEKDMLKVALKWMFSKNPQRAEKKADTFKLEVIKNKKFFDSAENGMVWLGHSSFLIRLNGIVLLLDPCLKDIPMFKRKSELPFPISDIKDVDYILYSHAHRDHFDEPSLKEILPNNKKAEFLVPMGMSNLLKKNGVSNIQEAAWYQKYNTKEELEIIFLPAKHWNKRGLSDFNTILWGSFLIRTKEISIYFAGDSAYYPHFKEIGEALGPFDICLMPIGAYTPSYIMKPSHTSPAEAVQAFNELRGKEFIPVHYGTYDLSDEPMGEPIRLLRALKEDGTLHGKLKELKVGEFFKV